MTIVRESQALSSLNQMPLNSRQLTVMNLGFAGVQMAWGLQMANASSIFESLGAASEQIPILWLAAPMSGLLIQPLVGYWSDRTQSPLGKRRPYFLVGGLAGILALVCLPFAANLAIAIGLIWILDIFLNMAITPFRSYVVDVVPESQRTLAFSTQSLSDGFGAFAASILPWCFLQLFNFDTLNPIDPSIRLALWIGALAMGLGLGITVIFSPPELPSMTAHPRIPQLSFWQAVIEMPPILRQLAWVQGFSWMGLFCLFLYFPPAIAHNVFGAGTEPSSRYVAGIAWAGFCLAIFNIASMVVSVGLPPLARRFSLPVLHGYALLCGAVALISLPWLHQPWLFVWPMIGLGLARASMVSLPYALLSSGVPESLNGLYMGLFNCFITLPQILISLGFGWIVHQYLGGDRMLAVALGGVFMGIAALQSFRVSESSCER